jgi:hypothetical protein
MPTKRGKDPSKSLILLDSAYRGRGEAYTVTMTCLEPVTVNGEGRTGALVLPTIVGRRGGALWSVPRILYRAIRMISG